ncbi:hypothetical protein [Kribbella sp. NBC_00359]|uniref:hypothetical protein n=1 Tax=Kribbella sp. NBC_00359 TaxID=2975966 RepID=UPI002E21AE77
MNVYVIDTGITNSSEFTGRVTLGVNTVPSESPAHPDASDCLTANHGTPIAGLIGGDTYGVAKNSNLISVRAFDCNRHADQSDITSAFQWVIDHAVRPAVISFSLNRQCFNDDGVPEACPRDDVLQVIAKEQQAMAAGIPIVAGAGDQGIDGCSSADFAPGVIAVGSVSRDGDPRPQSNFGSCVTVWAPGEFVMSASLDPASTQFSGTAFAAGYVAGAVAVMLGTSQLAGVPPAQLAARVTDQLIANATLTQDAKANRLLYIPPTFEGSSIALAKTSTGQLRVFGTDSNGTVSTNIQDAKNSRTWSGWTHSTSSSSDTALLSLGADANFDGRTEVLAASTVSNDVWQRQQLHNGLTGWSQLSGQVQSIAAAREQDGLMQLVGVNRQGQAWHATQTALGAPTFTTWQQFSANGTPAPAFTSIAEEADNQGIVNVFAVDTHGQIWTARQASVNSAAWFSFVPFPTLLGQQFASEVAVARGGSGKLVVYAITGSTVLWSKQTAPGSTSWGNWAGLVVDATHIAAETNDDGSIVLLTVAVGGAVSSVFETAPDTGLYTTEAEMAGATLRS